MKSKSGQLSEWSTKEDLLQIELQPVLREIQSLLVRLRIISRLSCSTFFEGVVISTMDFLGNYGIQNWPFLQKMDIACAVINTIYSSDPMESDCGLLRFGAIEIVSEMTNVIYNLPRDDANINSETLKTLLDLLSKAVQFHLQSSLILVDIRQDLHNKTVLEVLNKAIAILSRRPERINKDIELSLKQLVRLDCRDFYKFNLLHIACRNSDDDSLLTVRFLLKIEVDPVAVNNVGDGPIHILAVVRGDVDTRDAIARLLVEAGAHLDMVNKQGMTPADLWLKKCKEEGHQNVGCRDLPDWLQEGVPMLKCLSSRVIQRHRILNDDDKVLSAVLVPFVAMH